MLRWKVTKENSRKLTKKILPNLPYTISMLQENLIENPQTINSHKKLKTFGKRKCVFKCVEWLICLISLVDLW